MFRLRLLRIHFISLYKNQGFLIMESFCLTLVKTSLLLDRCYKLLVTIRKRLDRIHTYHRHCIIIWLTIKMAVYMTIQDLN